MFIIVFAGPSLDPTPQFSAVCIPFQLLSSCQRIILW